MTPEQHYEQLYPRIRWREPLPAKTIDGKEGLACRFCIALRGLRGSEINALPKSREEFDAHMARHIDGGTP